MLITPSPSSTFSTSVSSKNSSSENPLTILSTALNFPISAILCFNVKIILFLIQ